MKNFEIYPAIDLRKGQVVRLKYGDPNQQTVFGTDPTAVGRRWLDQGARWLHIVNLDGAFDEGGHSNWAVLPDLTGLPARIQFGGGIRSMIDIERALDVGVNRVVLGTAAVEDPVLLSAAIKRFGPEHIAVGIDARDGEVKTRGWRTGAGRSPVDLAREIKAAGVSTVIHTDISRDGVLTGVNAAASANLAQETGLHVIASGGVSSLEDVRAVVTHELAGVIIGRALYEEKFTVTEALQTAAGGEAKN